MVDNEFKDKGMKLILAILVYSSTILIASCATTCGKTDLKYVYTECQNNARWRVQVPNKTCTNGTVEFPTPGLKCDIQCSSGTYLNVMDNACVKCPAGTYSLGSGVRFDMWTALPEGFTMSVDRIDSSAGDSCSRAKWKPMGDYLAGQPDANCQLSLTYTANLAVEGEVSFYYRYRSDYALFAFEVQNGLCESVGREENASPLLEETDRNEIKLHRVSLKLGMNVLRWQILPASDRQKPSASSSSSSTPSEGASAADFPIAIHSIQVLGVPYVYTCQACHPGFSSELGAAKCVKCRPDTYASASGWEACRPCPEGQFAPAGSAGCSPRPPCRAGDYELAYAKPCSPAGGYQLAPAYQWVPPRVCSGGVELPAVPPASAAVSCREFCNPGMLIAASASPQLSCVACPEGQHSADNSGKCSPCPSNTQVVHEYVASNWMVTPPLMNLSCIVLREDSVTSCPELGWYLMGDRVQTSATRQRHSRVLTLDLPGFQAPPDADGGGEAASAKEEAEAARDISVLTIDFEVACDTPCRLFLLKFESLRHVEIKSWIGKQERKTFKYIIRRTNRHKFYLVFEPAPFADEDQAEAGNGGGKSTTGGGGGGGGGADWTGNRLTVFSVRATNALQSGGVRCQACPMGLKGQKCIPCPAGKYYHARNATCYPCPAGTVVAKRPADGPDACAPCSVGMRAIGGVSCDIDATPKRPPTADDGGSGGGGGGAGGRQFDFTRLVGGGYWLANGGKQFTGRGSQYLHVFNVSLSSRAKARCVSNTTGAADSLAVESFVCRVTVVPNQRNASRTLSALPTSFADRLLNASSSRQSPGAEAMLLASGWDSDADGMDTHVFFETDYTTQACRQRRITLVTLRCDPKAVQPRLSLPPKCPAGTCDGCNFHLMLETRQACQLCRTPDYERVNGECVLGKQTVHLYPPKRCYVPDGEPTKMTQVVDCPLVSRPVGIIMVVIIAVGFMSLAVAFHCYRKNRTLQYKYMQLAESKEGELPGVESCAVHEGEGDDGDDEEGDGDRAEVSVKRGGRGGGGGSAVLSRLRRTILPSGGGGGGGGVGGGRGGAAVEHLNLTEQMDDLSL